MSIEQVEGCMVVCDGHPDHPGCLWKEEYFIEDVTETIQAKKFAEQVGWVQFAVHKWSCPKCIDWHGGELRQKQQGTAQAPPEDEMIVVLPDELIYEDELYEKAKDEFEVLPNVTIQHIQRRFKIGYTRASKLMGMLKERGVVG